MIFEQKTNTVSENNQNLVNVFFPKFCEKSKLKIDRKVSNINTNVANVNNDHFCKHSKKCKICEITLNGSKRENTNFLLKAHHEVKNSGVPNYIGCKIPVNHRMNIDYMRSLLFDYKDYVVCDLLEFGFPIGFNGIRSEVLKSVDKKDIWKYRNHKGAEEYPNEMLEYLKKESKNAAIIGPFKESPFTSGIKLSPLNSLPKKDTTERRVILDLSFPLNAAVNSFVSKDEYLGETVDLVYPKVDDFAQLIKQKGRGCLLYKLDLTRAFRQIQIDPGDINLVSFVWKKHIFCDSVLSMGCRSAAYCCQRLTNAIAFIMFKIGIYILNYLDDLASAETVDKAQFAYETLGAVLHKCGIEEAKKKACPPSTVMTFIGILFNTEKLTMEVTTERLHEIRYLLQSWLDRDTASLKEIQSLLGKLNFIAACVRPGRIFISRMLQWLKVLNKEAHPRQQVSIPQYVQKDVLWWHKFLPLYNGVSLMFYEEWSEPDVICSSDACLLACGGFCSGKYYHTKFPDIFHTRKYNITILEMFATIICLKLWGNNFKGKKLQMFCDNQAVCHVINTGKSKCTILQDCLREIAFLAACNEFQIRMVHLSSECNRLSDHLSRWDLDISHRQKFFDLVKGQTVTESIVSQDLFHLTHTW